MTQIGCFQRTDDGYAGRLHSLNLDEILCIVAADASDADKAPDWRIFLGEDDAGLVIGAGWNRTGEKAGAYIALLIDCPTLTQPIRANLFQSTQQDGTHHLLWSRAYWRDERS